MNAHVSKLAPLSAPLMRPKGRRIQFVAPAQARAESATPAAASVSPIARLRLALTVRRERMALADAAPETLRDLGLTPEEAARESGRPFWDLPKGR